MLCPPSPTTNGIGGAPPICCGPRCCVPRKSPARSGVSPVCVSAVCPPGELPGVVSVATVRPEHAGPGLSVSRAPESRPRECPRRRGVAAAAVVTVGARGECAQCLASSIVTPQWRVPEWCVPGGVSPVCVSEWCVPGGVSPVACPRWRVPGGVSPVVCPRWCVPGGVVVLLVQSLRPERAGTGLSAVRIPECHPGGVSPVAPVCVSAVSPPGELPGVVSVATVTAGACGARTQCLAGSRVPSSWSVPGSASPVACPRWRVPGGVSPSGVSPKAPQWCVPGKSPVPGVCPRCVSPVCVPGVCPRCVSPNDWPLS
jgi:hypothetical protein